MAEENGCVFLHFRDVSVRTLDLSDAHLPPADLLRLYKRGRAGVPVLQDTTLWLRVSRIDRPAGFRADSGPQADPAEKLSPSAMVGEVRGEQSEVRELPWNGAGRFASQDYALVHRQEGK